MKLDLAAVDGMQSSFRGRRWIEGPARVPPEAEQVYTSLGVHRLVAHLLYVRNIRERDAVERFLAGPDAPLANPLLLKGVDAAVARIVRALERGERITIFGDYDVDGLTSTALLAELLSHLGAAAHARIPHRERDGYGLNGRILAEEAGLGTTLAIAVDCGISAREEIAAARTLGMDVVVIDHHHVPADLPEAVAIINPRQPGCEFPFKDLAAVGLTFCLASALLSDRQKPAEAERVRESLLGLVALGTVADVAPLVGENRTLVARGLRQLNRAPSVGIAKLCTVAGVKPGKIDARKIGHILGPRLNAAGRIDDAREAYELLTARDGAIAERLAAELDLKNRRRQQQTLEAAVHARERIGDEPGDLLFVASERFAPGVVGLVASKLVEQFYRPAVVVAIGADQARGSARSIEEFHVARALEACGDLLTKHGGHALAAGFSVVPERLNALRERLSALAHDTIVAATGEAPLLPRQRIDGRLSPRRLDDVVIRKLELLAPYGEGNPEPTFLGCALSVLHARSVGTDGAHLRLVLEDRRTRWNAIGFGLGAHRDALPDRVDVVYRVFENEWNGRQSLELSVEDLRASRSVV